MRDIKAARTIKRFFMNVYGPAGIGRTIRYDARRRMFRVQISGDRRAFWAGTIDEAVLDQADSDGVSPTHADPGPFSPGLGHPAEAAMIGTMDFQDQLIQMAADCGVTPDEMRANLQKRVGVPAPDVPACPPDPAPDSGAGPGESDAIAFYKAHWSEMGKALAEWEAARAAEVSSGQAVRAATE